MTKNDKPSTTPAAQKATKGVGKIGSQKLDQDTPSTADDRSQQTDRPGFDLGGSTGDTHAGTGLGFGEDAFDTPGERRLPGRRFDNKLTIPRWSGPEPRDTIASDETIAGAEAPPAPTKDKAR